MSRALAITETNERIVERIQAGDTTALAELWEVNKGLAAYIANRYTVLLGERRDCDFDDLVQAGYIGMHKAAGEYDPNRGAAFSTFSIFFMRREMRRVLGILSSKRDPIHDAAPLDVPLFDDGHNSATLLDTIAAPEDEENAVERDELRTAVRAAVGRMKHDINRRTIEAYYFVGTNTAQQAEAEGVTRGNISERLLKGYRELYNDPELRRWAVDYEYENLYRHKGVKAFKTSFSSVVEDIVIQAEEKQSKRAALYEVLGSLL